jgi:hypothetical protein
MNPKKNKYILMPRYYKAGRKHSIKILNTSSEDVAKFKYLNNSKRSNLHARRD